MCVALILLTIGMKFEHLYYWYRIQSRPEKFTRLTQVSFKDVSASPPAGWVMLDLKLGSMQIPNLGELLESQSINGVEIRKYSGGSLSFSAWHINTTSQPTTSSQSDDFPNTYTDQLEFLRIHATPFSFAMSKAELHDHARRQVRKTITIPICDELLCFTTDHAKGWVFFSKGERRQIIEAYSMDESNAVSIEFDIKAFKDQRLLESALKSINMDQAAGK